MSEQYDKVRQLVSECPLCNRPKLKGLLLCWPCHQKQKERNDGDYSKATWAKIAALEASLTPETAQSPKGVVLNSRTHKPR